MKGNWNLNQMWEWLHCVTIQLGARVALWNFQGFDHVRRVRQEFEVGLTWGKEVPDMENGAIDLIRNSRHWDQESTGGISRLSFLGIKERLGGNWVSQGLARYG
jgi:hypothetical protein